MTPDTDVLSQIQYVLLEPPDGGATFPSGLWTRDEVLANLNERTNRFLKAAQYLVGVARIDVTAGVSRYPLPQDWLTTVDLIWHGQDGTVLALTRSDSFEADLGMPTWETSRAVTPTLYMDEDAPLLQVALAPLPQIGGWLELLYVPQADAVTGDGGPVGVPDAYAAAVCKYGTLADLFAKDGRGRGPAKAAYAELRYGFAVEMAGILIASNGV